MKNLNTNRVQQLLDEEVEKDIIGIKDDGIEDDVKDELSKIQDKIEKEKKKYLMSTDKDNHGDVKKNKNYRVTQTEKQRRLREVIEMTNRGFTYSEIVNLCKKRWSCSDRTVERYISDAKKIEVVPEKELKIYRSNNISRCL